MAQINLLKQNTTTSHAVGPEIYRILVLIFCAVLVAIIGYYGWLFVEEHTVESQEIAVQAKLSTDGQTASTVKQRSELLTRQLQLQNLSSLVAAHLYWSQLFPELARVTLKTAAYDSLVVNPENNTVTLSAQVPSLIDLDQYMQVFNLAAFNKYFSNVRINGFSKAGGPNSTAVKFDVQMDFDPSLVKYNAAVSGAGQ